MCLPVLEIEDVALIRGSERSPDIGNGNPLQYSCPENTMNRFCDPLVGYSPGPHKQSDMTEHTHMWNSGEKIKVVSRGHWEKEE